jgi:hypothetical protein
MHTKSVASLQSVSDEVIAAAAVVGGGQGPPDDDRGRAAWEAHYEQ